ncbi:MAG: hypothetical protein LBQ84_05940 [Flavobacteriaceae bacterium]|jgi:hypothetical protein|nr:hypothetical protein [Flavobacteriaceae bacterium]
MKKNTLINFFAALIGIYFIVRAYFWYTAKTGDIRQNKYFALAFLCAGIISIIIQIVVNYRRNKKEK